MNAVRRGGLGRVAKVAPALRRLARTLAALSGSSSYIQYEDDPPPCDRTHQTPQGPPFGRTTPLSQHALGLVAWLAGIVFFLPIAWMALTSFHSEADAAANPPSFAASLTLDGYREFFGSGGGASPWPALINSTVASVASTLCVLLLALPAAYALSVRPVRKWTDVLFFFLSTKMLPAVAGLLPVYLFAKNAGLLDNIWLLVVLYTSMNLPIAVWMMRSFLAEVPIAVIEAARVDGARLPTILTRVIAPMALPGIAATALICFIFSWNELLFARVLTGVVAETAPVFLTGFITSQGLFLAKVCAASLVISLPVLAAGFAAQDKLVQGLSLGAVK